MWARRTRGRAQGASFGSIDHQGERGRGSRDRSLFYREVQKYKKLKFQTQLRVRLATESESRYLIGEMIYERNPATAKNNGQTTRFVS